MEPFIGQIQPFGFNFAPRGWALCAGQQMAISQNSALFSLLGTTYGGNGQTTFALPDLRARSAVNFGSGPGLTPLSIGEQGGSQTHTLLASEMPSHTHTLSASNEPGTNTTPQANNYLASLVGTSSKGGLYSTDAGTTIPLSNQTGISGGSQAFSIQNPFLAVNFSIALQGVFPSRN